MTSTYYLDYMALLAKRLAEVSPGGALTKSFFTNSGSESNETAISLVKRVSKRPYILGTTPVIPRADVLRYERARSGDVEDRLGAVRAGRLRPRTVLLPVALSAIRAALNAATHASSTWRTYSGAR